MSIPTPALQAWQSSITLGRDALLCLLGDRLRSESRLVIGTDPLLKYTSGVGRSQLVTRLIQDFSAAGSPVISLSGASGPAWHASLFRAAIQLNLPQSVFRRISDLTGAIRHELKDRQNWLLVADSLSGLADLNELIRGLDSGRVIAILNQPSTEKYANWPPPVPLGSLSSDDALQLLGKTVGHDWHNTSEVIAATQIITLLERNPRAVTLAGRTMRLAGISPQEYLLSLKAQQESSLQKACVSLLVRTIEQRDAVALKLLAALVACGASPIPAHTVQQISNLLPNARAAMRLLVECGLLEGSLDQTHHRITAHADLMLTLTQSALFEGARRAGSAFPQISIRDRLHEHVCGDLEPAHQIDLLAEQRVSVGQILAEQASLAPEEITLVRQAADSAVDLLLPEVAQELLFQTLEQAVKSKSRQQAVLQPLIELGTALMQCDQTALARRRWRQAVEVCPPETHKQAELLLCIAEIDVNENRLDRALARLISVGEIIKRLPPSDHTQLLDAQRKYLKAGVLLGRGETRAARDLFRSALNMRTPLLPVDHMHLMRNRLMLARTEFLLKDLATSEQILLNEIAIREQSPRVSEMELAVACNFLAEQYYLSGRLSDAEPVYERTLDLRRSNLAPGHRLIGEMANRLAVIKSARGAYKESDVLFRESLTSVEQSYGAEHFEVARVLNDLAESLFAQNKVEPARRLLEKALHIQEKSLKPNDARLSRTRCNLASVYVTRGRFAEAVRLYERDVVECQSQQVPDKASLATSLNNLAEALRSLGRNAEAEERLQQALVIREQLVGPDHPQVAQVLNNLGYLHLQQHRYSEASQCLQRALRIRESCLSPNHPHLATTLGTLAEIHFAQGHYEDARPHYARAIEIALNAFGERHPQVASLQICSARNEMRLGHVGRAELMLLRGKTTIEEVLGANHRMSSRVLLSLSELAHAESRYEPAFPMLERCLSIQLDTMSSQRLEIAETLQLITENLTARGLYAEALPRIKEAIEIQHAVLGPQHLELIPNTLRLGEIHLQLGDAAAAEEAFRFVLDHANTTTQSQFRQVAFEKLPDVLVQLQKYDEAAELLTRKVSHLELAGPSHALISVCSQLAGIYYLLDQPAAAAPWMERCVELSEILHGADSPETARHLDNLAGVRFLLGEYELAEPTILRSIQILEAEHPTRTAALTKARENYIHLLRKTNRVAEADEMVSVSTATVASPPVSPPGFLPSSHVLDDL